MKDTAAVGGAAGRSIARMAVGVLLALAWAVLVAGVLVLLSTYRLLPDGPEEWTFDWRAAHFSQQAPAQRDDIAVVLVTEDTLARYPSRSPVDRLLLAELVRAIDAAEPKLIGLDFIFDRPTDAGKDDALANAIRNARTPIVLGGLDNRARRLKERNYTYQASFLTKTERTVGHLFFAGQNSSLKVSDHVIRAMAPPHPGSPYPKSFAEQLAEHDGAKHRPATSLIAWLLPPNDGKDDLFAIIPIGEHDPITHPGTGERLLSIDESAVLKGKIVLVGGQLLDMDRHLTPLSVADRERMAGVLIHAQIVAQLRDGRSISVTSPRDEFIALVVIGLVGFYLGRRWGLNRFGVLLNVVSIAVLITITVSLFWNRSLIVPSTTLLFAWLAGVAGGHSYDWVARKVGIVGGGSQ